MRRLTACWTSPPLPPAGPVLSFLRPLEEEALAGAARGPFLRARAMAPAARAAARATYLDVGAAIGAAISAAGTTLRADCGGEAASPWWYHPSAFKDCETDPAFTRLLAVRAILDAAETLGASEIETWGSPPEIVAVLRSRWSVVAHDAPARRSSRYWTARALAARLAFAAGVQADALAARAAGAGGVQAEILLLGYWDWSCFADGDEVADRYFKSLPERLRGLGRKISWLCWLDPGGDPARPARARAEAARDAARHGVLLLQSFLGPLDVLRAVLDLRPWRAYRRRRNSPALRAAFRREGMDLFPLFEERLLRGFLDASLPRAALIERACARAAARLRPRAALHFLEHFPHARACFAGLRAGAPDVLLAAVQHAGFCAEKTFYFLDPAREFRGEPDGRPVPTPDLVFAMGERPRGHFLSCGYPPERVLATGSPRYDHVRPPRPAKPWSGPGVRLLLVPALDLGAEAPMLEAARAAAAGLPRVELRLREHPFARPETDAAYARARAGLALSTGTLAEDLAWADAALFTYSTVAEEAVLLGVPAWQWLPLGYNASALSEAADIPRFGAVAELRAALASFRAGLGLPDEDARRGLLRGLFAAGDGGAAERVAAALDAALKTRRG